MTGGNSPRKGTPESQGSTDEVRLVYFILAHHRPEQLQMLVDAVAEPRDLVFLHIDLKSALGLKAERAGVLAMARKLAAERPNVLLMRPRFTNWGGWSMSSILLAAIERALKVSRDWTHFINLSGQCYPLKPIAQLRSALAAAGERVFVELRHFSSLPPNDWHLRWRAMVELPFKAVPLAMRRHAPRDFELEYKGSQWCILPRSFCEWQAQAPVARVIKRYLRNLHLSDELIMQTLVRNGPWRERAMPHYGREILWPGPKILTAADLPTLEGSPAFFARKFDTSVDPDLIAVLARRCGFALRPPPSAGVSSQRAPVC